MFCALRSRLALVLVLSFGSAPLQASELPERLLNLPAEEAGRILSEHLQSGMPAERAEFKGHLRIRPGPNELLLPLSFTLAPDPGQWQAIYETEAAAGLKPERLQVLHTPGQPNLYLYSRPGQEPVALKPERAFLPFGSSDFWLVDLGLDFFNWPTQRVLKGEMRLGRYAYVLESRLPEIPPHGYSKVVAWIDRETGGPLIAEAYDANGKLLKEFRVKRFKKLEGQWQLSQMEIRNVQTGSRTRVEFKFGQGQ